jgi:hypothetical protein
MNIKYTQIFLKYDKYTVCPKFGSVGNSSQLTQPNFILPLPNDKLWTLGGKILMLHGTYALDKINMLIEKLSNAEINTNAICIRKIPHFFGLQVQRL